MKRGSYRMFPNNDLNGLFFFFNIRDELNVITFLPFVLVSLPGCVLFGFLVLYLILDRISRPPCLCRFSSSATISFE